MPSLEFLNDVSMQDDSVVPIVVFYLTLEPTDLPSRRGIPGCDVVDFQTNSSTSQQSPLSKALKLTFNQRASVELPTCLVTFGSDPQQCNVVLDATRVSPVHCKVHAQLNSGFNVHIIEDTSEIGTRYDDLHYQRNKNMRTVLRRREAVEGLSVIAIGPYIFHCHQPSSEIEIAERDRWFRRHEPIPVTKHGLTEQLRGNQPSYRNIGKIGKGGFGDVFKYMERQTGLMIAVKVQTVEDDKLVRQEIQNMKALSHPFLVECIDSIPNSHDTGQITWRLLMPLYRGSLIQALPRMNLEIKERAMTQIVSGLTHMHDNGFLHKDIKPENIFVCERTPLHVVIGDLGLTTTMEYRGSCGGTDGYAAPEVYNKLPITSATDVYSLGVTFLEMLDFDRTQRYGIPYCLRNIKHMPPCKYPRLVQQMTARHSSDRPILQNIQRLLNERKDYSDSVQLPPQPSPTQVQGSAQMGRAPSTTDLFPSSPDKNIPRRNQLPEKAPLPSPAQVQKSAQTGQLSSTADLSPSSPEKNRPAQMPRKDQPPEKAPLPAPNALPSLQRSDAKIEGKPNYLALAARNPNFKLKTRTRRENMEPFLAREHMRWPSPGCFEKGVSQPNSLSCVGKTPRHDSSVQGIDFSKVYVNKENIFKKDKILRLDVKKHEMGQFKESQTQCPRKYTTSKASSQETQVKQMSRPFRDSANGPGPHPSRSSRSSRARISKHREATRKDALCRQMAMVAKGLWFTARAFLGLGKELFGWCKDLKDASDERTKCRLESEKRARPFRQYGSRQAGIHALRC